MDFLLETYRLFLEELKSKTINIYSLKDYFKSIAEGTQSGDSPFIILRHDVDRKPYSSLKMAELEKKYHINSTYFFRTKNQTLKPEIITEIASFGHEIGYHYENLSDVNGDYNKAINDFELNLKILRKYYPVENIAMHGSPLSRWDNRLLWHKYDYRDFGITAEPYFDFDFNEVLYLTDAGRKWSDDSVNIRDKVKTNFSFNINSTQDFLYLLSKSKLPDKIMLNIHPEHWASTGLEWIGIRSVRVIKNTLKKLYNHLKPITPI